MINVVTNSAPTTPTSYALKFFVGRTLNHDWKRELIEPEVTKKKKVLEQCQS